MILCCSILSGEVWALECFIAEYLIIDLVHNIQGINTGVGKHYKGTIAKDNGYSDKITTEYSWLLNGIIGTIQYRFELHV